MICKYKEISISELTQIVKDSITFSELMRKLGYTANRGNSSDRETIVSLKTIKPNMLYIFRVTYKKYIDGKEYKREVDIVASDVYEAAEKMETILNKTGEDCYTIYLVKFIDFFDME